MSPSPAVQPTAKDPTVRITVDVRRDDHRALKRTADEMADELGINRVPIQQVMAALAHRVTEDQDLRKAVVSDIRGLASQYER